MQFTTNSQGQIQSNESEYWITFDEWIDPFGGNWVSAWPNILLDPWLVGKEMRGKHIKVMELFPSHQNGDWLLLKVFNTSHIYRRCFQSLIIILTGKTGNWQFHYLPFLITSTTMNRYFMHVWIRVDYVAQSWWPMKYLVGGGAFLVPLWLKRKKAAFALCKIFRLQNEQRLQLQCCDHVWMLKESPLTHTWLQRNTFISSTQLYMVNGLHLFGTFQHVHTVPQSALQWPLTHPFRHIHAYVHTLMGGCCHVLPKDTSNMWTVGAGIGTTNPSITNSQLALPTEPQLQISQVLSMSDHQLRPL